MVVAACFHGSTVVGQHLLVMLFVFPVLVILVL